MEERQHKTDMVQTYKILHGFDKTLPLFQMMLAGDRTTRLAADPLSVRVLFARLDIRKNFYRVRAAAAWNEIPAEIKKTRERQPISSLCTGTTGEAHRMAHCNENEFWRTKERV